MTAKGDSIMTSAINNPLMAKPWEDIYFPP